MQVLSPSMVCQAVLREIDRHPEGTMSGIVGPVFSGLPEVLDEIVGRFTALPRSVVVELGPVDYFDSLGFMGRLKAQLEDEYCPSAFVPDGRLSLGDNVYCLLEGLTTEQQLRMLLLVRGFEKLSMEDQYALGAQLRNVREKSKANQMRVGVHSICSGAWSYAGLLKVAEDFAGSFPLDLSLFVGESMVDDVRQRLAVGYGDGRCELTDLHAEYLHELTRGCDGLIGEVLRGLGNSPTCEAILCYLERNVACSSMFVEHVRSAVTEASPIVRGMLAAILAGRHVLLSEWDPLLEAALLSGLFAWHGEGKERCLVIRSWAHEVTLRTYADGLLPGERIHTDPSQIIPPSFALNRRAYTLVMEAENELRNLLTCVLSDIPHGSHPFTALDGLGLVKEFKRTPVTIEEFCRRSRTELLSTRTVVAHSSLSSYLDLSDLYDLMTDEAEDRRTGMRSGVYSRIQSMFPDRNALRRLLGRLRDLRNPVAHNNLITEATIRELREIVGSLRVALRMYGGPQ